MGAVPLGLKTDYQRQVHSHNLIAYLTAEWAHVEVKWEFNEAMELYTPTCGEHVCPAEVEA